MHLTLGILRQSQAVSYALSFFWLDGFAVHSTSAGNACRWAVVVYTRVKNKEDMKKTIRAIFPAFIFLTALVNGCIPVSTPVPIQPTPTLISPTNTPVPTVTPTTAPTLTATPTITPPVITKEFLTDVKILFHDPFDNNDSLNNWTQGNVVDGIFELKWGVTNVSYKRQRLIDGDGVILKFKLQNANDVSGFSFDTGIWRTESDRGFGIINTRHPHVTITQGIEEIDRSRLSGNLSLKTDTWYNILMAVGKNEEFLAVIWDPADESHRIIYKISLGKNWSDRTWAFDIVIWGDEIIYIDDFYKISFGDIQ